MQNAARKDENWATSVVRKATCNKDEKSKKKSNIRDLANMLREII